MKTPPCLESPKALEDAARLAEQRKHQAIDRLTAKLASKDRFQWTMANLNDADMSAHSRAPAAQREKGR